MDTERRFAGYPIPRGLTNGYAAEFVERRLSHRLEGLAARWTGCPACGARELRLPRLDELERQPEAVAACAGCGAVYGSEPGGAARELVPGGLPSGLPS